MIAKLLVAYDGSQQSEKAFGFALDMASRYSAKILVVAVARPPEPPVQVEMEAALENATQYYQEHFKRLSEQTEVAGIEAIFQVKVGHPAEQLVRMAEIDQADVIVMGHRGETLLQKWLLGSVAKRVLSYAHCTVIIVR